MRSLDTFRTITGDDSTNVVVEMFCDIIPESCSPICEGEVEDVADVQHDVQLDVQLVQLDGEVDVEVDVGEPRTPPLMGGDTTGKFLEGRRGGVGGIGKLGDRNGTARREDCPGGFGIVGGDAGFPKLGEK